MEGKKVGFRLDGKKVLVTGAARGIGKAISLVFAEHGANLALIDLDQEPLEEVVTQITKLGGKALYIVADVSQLNQIKKLTEQTLQELGWIDILVNNAGVGLYKPAEKLTMQDWDKVLTVNLKGSFFLNQVVGKHMIKRKSGKIINISSQAGVVGIEGLTAYGASKAGIILYTKVLAVEWGKHNININVIAPTSIKTRQALPGKAGEELVRKTPLGRMGEPGCSGNSLIFSL